MNNLITIQDFYNSDFELQALPNNEPLFTIVKKKQHIIYNVFTTRQSIT